MSYKCGSCLKIYYKKENAVDCCKKEESILDSVVDAIAIDAVVETVADIIDVLTDNDSDTTGGGGGFSGGGASGEW